jgi:hypothetical protein
MVTTVTFKPVLCGTELTVVQEGIPAVIPPEMCVSGLGSFQSGLQNPGAGLEF